MPPGNTAGKCERLQDVRGDGPSTTGSVSRPVDEKPRLDVPTYELRVFVVNDLGSNTEDACPRVQRSTVEVLDTL